MNGRKVITTLFHLLERGRTEEAKQHLSGDFLLMGWTPQPLTKNQFLALMEALQKSMPDLNFHIQPLQEDDQWAQSDRVAATIQLTGTQTARFLLPPYDIGPSATSPKKIVLPKEQISCTIMGSTIESMIVSPEKNQFEQIIAHLTTGETNQQVSATTSMAAAWPQPDAKGGSARSPEEARRRYNKQSNCYDPQGGTFTPSHPFPDPASHVDPSASSHSGTG